MKDNFEKKERYGRKDDRYSTPREPAPGAVIGRNAVRELLKSGREIDKMFVRRGDREGSIVVLIAEAKSAGLPVVEVEKNKLQVCRFLLIQDSLEPLPLSVSAVSLLLEPAVSLYGLLTVFQ